jgi:hypothetical protein
VTGKPPDELFDAQHNRWQWRSHAPQVSDPLATVLDRMLSAAPSQRYQSAAETLEAIKPASVHPVPVPVMPPPITVNPLRPIPPTTIPSVLSSGSQSSSSNPAAPAANPAASGASAASSPVVRPRSRPAPITPFRLPELLANAGFAGFEAGLLAIAIVSILGTTFISAGFWLVLVAGLVFAQSRRIIERMDLPIIAGVSLGAVLLVGALRQILVASSNPIGGVVAIALFTGLAAVCLTALFRLIYLLIRRLF